MKDGRKWVARDLQSSILDSHLYCLTRLVL